MGITLLETSDITLLDCTLQRLGARSTEAIYNDYNYWTLFTSLFLHKDFVQLLLNCLGLSLYGFSLEKHYGGHVLLPVFFGSSVFGNLTSLYIYDSKLEAGAASGVYGVFALLIVYIVEYYILMDDRQNMFNSFLWVIASTFLLYLSDDNIDSLALPVAFISGLMISFIVT